MIQGMRRVRSERALEPGGSISCRLQLIDEHLRSRCFGSYPKWSKRSSFHQGFTLIELLVSISIVVLLLSLSFRAAASARATYLKIKCSGNLRQIGVAMNNYYSAHNMFPPNHLMTTRRWSSNRYSGFLFLLPYLEQTALYHSCNLSFARQDTPDYRTRANETVKLSRVSTYLCPSDPDNKHLCNYRFNYGVGPAANEVLAQGPFALLSLPSQASVKDGLSNTAFVSERYSGSFAPSPEDMKDVKFARWPGARIPGDDVYIKYCINAVADGWNRASGHFWMYNGMEYTDYNHNGLPNDPRPSCGYTDFGLHPPRSYHINAVNVLYGDGRVGGVSNGVATAVWRSLGTPNGND